MEIPPISFLASIVAILCSFVSFCPIQCDNSPNRPELRLIGGEFANEGEFPHQVLMLIPSLRPGKGGKICGGSILTPDHILLAGHCVTKITDASQIIFTAGVHNLNKTSSDGTNVLGAEIIFHPCYNQENNVRRDLLVNDIAIVRLANPLILNERNIKTIQIDEQNLANDGKSTVAIGWGRTHDSKDDGAYSPDLKKAEFFVVKAEVCKKAVQAVSFATLTPESQLCVSYKGRESFLCEGDSGGPLLCQDQGGTNVVCGITSITSNLDKTKQRCHGPTIFTRVYHYRDWIKSVLAGKRGSKEGCVDPPLPYVTTTTEDYEYQYQEEPSHSSSLSRPLALIYVIGVFISFWGKKILLN